MSNYIGMVVSTGVGGGIVLNGRLSTGQMAMPATSVTCSSNPTGTRTQRRSRAARRVGSGTGIAAATGHPAAEADVEMRRQVGVWVGRAVASVANLLDLQLAVVAGSVALGIWRRFLRRGPSDHRRAEQDPARGWDSNRARRSWRRCAAHRGGRGGMAGHGRARAAGRLTRRAQVGATTSSPRPCAAVVTVAGELVVPGGPHCFGGTRARLCARQALRVRRREPRAVSR